MMKFISPASILLPLLVGLFVFAKLDKVQRMFFWFILFSALFEVNVIVVATLTGNNAWMFRLFLVCDLLFFLWYYHNVFEKPIWDFRFNLLPVLLIAAQELTPKTIWLFSDTISWFHLLIFLFFIVQSLQAMVRCFEEYQTELLRAPAYWVSFARLFYFMLIVFAYVMPVFDMYGKGYSSIMYASGILNNFANICLNVLYAISFLCLRMTSRYPY